jgi:hypothetical protein
MEAVSRLKGSIEQLKWESFRDPLFEEVERIRADKRILPAAQDDEIKRARAKASEKLERIRGEAGAIVQGFLEGASWLDEPPSDRTASEAIWQRYQADASRPGSSWQAMIERAVRQRDVLALKTLAWNLPGLIEEQARDAFGRIGGQAKAQAEEMAERVDAGLAQASEEPERSVRQGRIELKKKAEVLGAYITAAEHAAEGAHKLAINSYMAAGKVEGRNLTPQERREKERQDEYDRQQWEKEHPPLPGGHYESPAERQERIARNHPGLKTLGEGEPSDG